jgi:aminopeptidase N
MNLHSLLSSKRTCRLVCTALSLAVIVSAASAERLSQSVKPEHYSLTLAPDLKAATFTGHESIDVTLAEPCASITLNSADITYKSVTITANGNTQTATVAVDADKEEATFTVPQPVSAGKATLTIDYSGILNDKLRGFYLSKTAKRNYAVTQFESTDARRAFPSFDEPAFKATFNVSLVIDSGDTAISNGPIVKDTPGPGDDKHTLQFLTTPKMSTYLLAFLVGDFQCSSGESDGVGIRVCGTPDKVALTHYGVGVAESVLHYYNHYFGIPYPLKKLDLIGLPDFEAGAMENFGAITYRETELLLDEKTASIDAKKNVELVIAHEMAHQWFGDLVTMQWWDNVWLNEGFATWMENKAVAVRHPDWDIDQQVIADLDGTLNLDAQPTTRAIRARADTRNEIEEMFDGISYGKASDVLLTVENYLGEETFRKGVHAYLSAHLYGNATAEDFWNAQTAVSHKPVDKIMESLIAQPGVPLLTFGEPGGGRVSVEQRRFFSSPSGKSDTAQAWTLPVCFKAGNSAKCELLSPSDSSLDVPASKPFFANAAGKGYFRSKYPADVYASLVSGVETTLTPVERISLIGDEWAQVRANTATVGDYLNLVTAVKDDPNEQVVGDALGGVNTIAERIAATPEERSALGAWINRTFSPVYAKLGPPSPSDSPNAQELRAALFGVLGYYGKNPKVIADARAITEKFIADPSSVDPNLGQTAAFIAARNGDAALFGALQKVYETTTDPEYQEGALRLLVEFQDPALLNRALEYATTSKVRSQDAALLFAIALSSNETRDQAWKFVQANWDKFASQMAPEMGSDLVASTGSFCSAADRDDVKSFFTEHKVAAAAGPLKHAIERIDGCIELRSLQEPKLKEWLATQPQS